MPKWRMAHHANCWGPLGGEAVGVTSISQLAYRTFGDMNRAAAEIAEAGYEGVEFFDGNVLDGRADNYAAMRKLLAQTRLALVAIYSAPISSFAIASQTNCRASRGRRTRRRRSAASISWSAAAPAASMGRAKRITTIWPRRSTRCRRSPQSAGCRRIIIRTFPTIVENPAEVRKIFARTGIGFCPDTAHLAAAGGDVASMVREHAARITYVHLKGWRRDPFAFVPVGQGDCDNAAVVIRALKAIGYAGWICIELDAWPDPAGGARESLAFVEAEAAKD